MPCSHSHRAKAAGYWRTHRRRLARQLPRNVLTFHWDRESVPRSASPGPRDPRAAPRQCRASGARRLRPSWLPGRFDSIRASSAKHTSAACESSNRVDAGAAASAGAASDGSFNVSESSTRSSLDLAILVQVEVLASSSGAFDHLGKLPEPSADRSDARRLSLLLRYTVSNQCSCALRR